MLSPFIVGILIGYPLGIIFNCKSDGIQTVSCIRGSYDYISYIDIFNFLPFLTIFTFPVGILTIIIGFFIKAYQKKKAEKLGK